jgi:hypothetical protein
MNCSQCAHFSAYAQYFSDFDLVEHVFLDQCCLQSLVLGYADAVQEDEFVQQYQHCFLHFMQAFLILTCPVLPVGHCVPQQQVPCQFLIEKRF